MTAYRVYWNEQHQTELDTEAEGIQDTDESVVEWVEDNFGTGNFVGVTHVEKL